MGEPWFMGPIGVYFGDVHSDVALGGSHDMTILCAPNTPITAIAEGIISDTSAPLWGKQVCIKLDVPINGHQFACLGLHLSAIEPSLRVGQRIKFGDLIGWSGGCTEPSMYMGTSNPTGQNFLNSPSMSSQPQCGIALHDGLGYGYIGWKVFPPIDISLDPTPLLLHAKSLYGVNQVNALATQMDITWNASIRLLKTMYGAVPIFGAPCLDLWEKLYLSKKYNLGPPLTGDDAPYNDWSNVKGTCVWFGGGYRIETINGKARAYNGQNQEIGS